MIQIRGVSTNEKGTGQQEVLTHGCETRSPSLSADRDSAGNINIKHKSLIAAEWWVVKLYCHKDRR